MARKTVSDFFDSAETKDKLELHSESTTDETIVNNKFVKSKEYHKSLENSELGSEQESEDSKELLEPVTSDTAATEANDDTAANTNVTDDANQQYIQYAMQYQQYYTQYYTQYYPQTHPQPSMPATSDPAYEFYTNSTGPVAPGASFDASRANKQMNAYFDPNKFQAVLSPEMQAAQRAVKEQQQARLTAKEIEAFKKKKIEKKKAKNRWFYE